MSDSTATKTDLPEGFPKSQDELNKIIDSRLAPKFQRISELEGQVNTLTGEKDALTATVTEKDSKIAQLEGDVTEKSRELLVTSVSHTKGVPAKWLKGDDQAALEASADEWLADAKGVATLNANHGNGDGENESGEQNGQQAGQQAGGYVGSAGTGSEEPARPSFEERKQAAYERASKQQKGALA